MAKNQHNVQSARLDESISVDEYCAHLSILDKRTELIGAFHRSILAAGTVKLKAIEFSQEFLKFCNKPA